MTLAWARSPYPWNEAATELTITKPDGVSETIPFTGALDMELGLKLGLTAMRPGAGGGGGIPENAITHNAEVVTHGTETVTHTP